MQAGQRRRSISLVVMVILVVACRPTEPDASPPAGAQHLQRALAGAHTDRTYRIKGTVTFGVPLLSWEGIVVGDDEQYVLHTVGRIIDSRRIAGRKWSHQLGSSQQWKPDPADAPIDAEGATA